MTFVIAAVAQLLAAGIFVGILQLYNYASPGTESWGILLPTLALAFAAEVVWLHLSLRKKFSALRCAVMTIVCWIVGLISVGFLDWVGKRAPLIAFAISILTLLVIISYRRPAVLADGARMDDVRRVP